MDIHNAHAGHIGLQTIDNNVLHTRWPCFSHPGSITCQEAQQRAAKKGFRTLVPAPSQPPVHRFTQPT